MAGALLRIAHAHGNRRHRIERALEAGVDLIEMDLRWDRGVVWVRHEHRASRLPLLYNVDLKGIHREGPWAASLRRLFVRLDHRPIRLAEVLEAAVGRAGVLLDMKAGGYSASAAHRFAEAVFRATEGFPEPVRFCGHWRLLDILREHEAAAGVHYSIDSDSDWEALRARADGEGDAQVRGVTIQTSLLTEQRARVLRDGAVEFYCWDVDSYDVALRALHLGASGVIADDLNLLRELAAVRVEQPDAAAG